MKNIILLSSLLALSLSASAARTSRPLGFYSDGSIKNAVELPSSGPGYMRLFLKRNRGWGAKEMIDLLVNSAGAMNKSYPKTDRLQVGDISQKGGGPLLDLHGSHQNGLDVDLTYYRKDRVEQTVTATRGFMESMVLGGRISRNFDTKRNWEFMKRLHENGKVQRIFVDPVIKEELCKFARKRKEYISHRNVLRSLRPYPNHHDHMHVRLKCPKGASQCRSQEDPPAGAGC